MSMKREDNCNSRYFRNLVNNVPEETDIESAEPLILFEKIIGTSKWRCSDRDFNTI